MREMRKLFVAIFATMLPFAAAWADNVAKIGETEYETLAEAVSAAKSGEIIHVVAQGEPTPFQQSLITSLLKVMLRALLLIV